MLLGAKNVTAPENGSQLALSDADPATRDLKLLDPLILETSCVPSGSRIPITLSYTVVGGGNGYSPPVLNYVASGTSSSATLTTTPTPYYMDLKTTWHTTSQLPGAPAGERWATPQAVGGTVTQCVTITLQYTHQYLTDLEYGVKGSGLSSTQEPTITYYSFGVRTSTRNAGYVWIDAGTKYSYTNPLAGTTQSQRWFSLTSSGNISSASRVFPVYYYQMLERVSYSSVDGGGNPPTFSSTSFGSPVNKSVNTVATLMWLDAGSAYSFTNPLSGSTSNERWSAISSTGLISQPGALSPNFFHQYLASLSYSLTGGGSVKSPTLSYLSFGSQNIIIVPNPGSVSVWMDAGSRYSALNPLGGSSAAERWATPNPDGSCLFPVQLFFPYYHQYAMSLSYSVSGGGSPLSPVLTGLAFGKQVNVSIALQPSTLWLDNSTAWSISNPLALSSPSERWATDAAVQGTLSNSSSATLSYLHQYYLSLGSSPAGSGSITPKTGWQNAGINFELVATPNSGWGFQRWAGSGTGSYSGPKRSVNLALSGPISEIANFFSGILLNATDGGSIHYQYGQNTGAVQEGTTVNILVPFGTNLSLHATPTSPFTKFDSWTGGIASRGAQTWVVVNAPMVVSASFVYDYVTLIVIGAPSIIGLAVGGTVLTRRRKRPAHEI